MDTEKTPQPLNQNEDLPSLRTYQSDISEALKEKQGSVIKIAIAEQEKKQQEEVSVKKEKKKHTRYILWGLLLLLMGGLVGVYFVWEKIGISKNDINPILTQNLIATIETDTKEALDIPQKSGMEIRTLLGEKVTSAIISKNTILELIPTQEINGQVTAIGITYLLELFETKINIPLIRSFVDSGSVIGIYNTEKNSLFLLLKNNSYASAFAGMLSWEKTLLEDTGQLFSIDTKGEHAYLLSKPFVDRVLKNQDTRVLLDADGTVILLYSFLGEKKDILLITDREDTLSEVVNRLTSVRAKR